MKDDNIIRLSPESKAGYSTNAWMDEIDHIFKIMPKIKDKVINHFNNLESDPDGKHKYVSLKIEIEGKNRNFEITIKMSEDKDK
jgi:hypothetical protein